MGVGLNWVDWFLKRHKNHVQTYHAHPLEASVARLSMNTHTNITSISSNISSRQETMGRPSFQKISMEVMKPHSKQVRDHPIGRWWALQENKSNISKKRETGRTLLSW
jgi:hypothetical protein